MKRWKSLWIILFSLCLALALPGEAFAASKTSLKALSALKISSQQQSISAVSSSSKTSVSAAVFLKLLRLQRTSLKLTRSRINTAVQKREMTALKKKVLSYLSSNGLSGSEWSVYVKNLKTNQSFTINRRRYIAASTIKLFAMAAAYDKVQKGQLPLTAALSRLLFNMIVYSDNDSFNGIVCDYVGSDYLNQFLQKQGFSSTVQCNGIGPGSHSYIEESKGKGINYTSAADCGKLLEKIYRGTLVSKSYSGEMLRLLKAQIRRSKIPAGIPKGVTVANKTGEYEQYEHDAAIVYGPKTPYIICVFSESDNPGKISHIQAISKLVYQYLNPS